MFPIARSSISSKHPSSLTFLPLSSLTSAPLIIIFFIPQLPTTRCLYVTGYSSSALGAAVWCLITEISAFLLQLTTKIKVFITPLITDACHFLPPTDHRLSDNFSSLRYQAFFSIHWLHRMFSSHWPLMPGIFYSHWKGNFTPSETRALFCMPLFLPLTTKAEIFFFFNWCWKKNFTPTDHQCKETYLWYILLITALCTLCCTLHSSRYSPFF